MTRITAMLAALAVLIGGSAAYAATVAAGHGPRPAGSPAAMRQAVRRQGGSFATMPRQAKEHPAGATTASPGSGSTTPAERDGGQAAGSPAEPPVPAAGTPEPGGQPEPGDQPEPGGQPEPAEAPDAPEPETGSDSRGAAPAGDRGSNGDQIAGGDQGSGGEGS